MNNRKLVVIVGKSGAGKDYARKCLVSNIENSNSIIRDTTRPPRDGEVNGESYRFIDEKLFFEKEYFGEYLEIVKYNDWYYGTCLEEIKDDKINICVLSPNCLYEILDVPDLLIKVIYIDAPWLTRLRRSIKREGRLRFEMIRRLFSDMRQFRHFKNDVRFHMHGHIVSNKKDMTNELETVSRQIMIWSDNMGEE